MGFALRWLQLQSTSSRCTGSVVAAYGLRCSSACGIVPGQGSSVPCIGRRILNYCAAVRCLVAQSCLTLCDPMDCSPPGSSVHGILQARNWNGLPFPSPGHLPNSGIKPSSPALQVNSLPSESPGKPKNTGVGNLSPLQGIFSTQE